MTAETFSQESSVENVDLIKKPIQELLKDIWDEIDWSDDPRMQEISSRLKKDKNALTEEAHQNLINSIKESLANWYVVNSQEDFNVLKTSYELATGKEINLSYQDFIESWVTEGLFTDGWFSVALNEEWTLTLYKDKFRKWYIDGNWQFKADVAWYDVNPAFNDNEIDLSSVNWDIQNMSTDQLLRELESIDWTDLVYLRELENRFESGDDADKSIIRGTLKAKLESWIVINNQDDFEAVKIIYKLSTWTVLTQEFSSLENPSIAKLDWNNLQIVKEIWDVERIASDAMDAVTTIAEDVIRTTEAAIKNEKIEIQNEIKVGTVEWVDNPQIPTKKEILDLLEKWDNGNRKSPELKYALQVALAMTWDYKWAIDQIYGWGTSNAVRDFQKKNNLTVDWDAWGNTFKAIIAELNK